MFIKGKKKVKITSKFKDFGTDRNWLKTVRKQCYINYFHVSAWSELSQKRKWKVQERNS